MTTSALAAHTAVCIYLFCSSLIFVSSPLPLIAHRSSLIVLTPILPMSTLLLPTPSTNGHATMPADLTSLVSSLKPSARPSSLIPHPLSSGPRSPSGKARSRLNGVVHGLNATDEVFLASLKPRERSAYRKIRRSLITFYQPQTSYETLLVDRMAIQHLRMLRLYSLESVAMDFLPINKGSDRSIFPHLDRFSRYDVRIERQLRILHNRLILFKNIEVDNCFKPIPTQE